ncbi:MAG: FkbM family methyltransferase [Chitinophagaceae bacterium]|nr:FkbM family methyltransferase [Chitinophagaceae bacterium]
MASVQSPLRRFVKPILFKLLGKSGYKWAQFYAKKKDITNRLVEEIEMELLPQFVSKDDDVLDIGANYAYYTERLSKLAPSGRVYAFEPIPFTYDVAAKLVKSFRLKNVNLYQKGVGQKTETMRFSVPKMEFGSISAGQAHMAGRDNGMIKGSDYYVSDANEEFDCHVVDIDTFLLPELKKLSFVKIDIEGAEYFALKGMEKTLQRFKPVILIEIVPLFLESFKIPLPVFQGYIEQTLNYKIFGYNQQSKKLEEVKHPINKDRNYILIEASKVSDYKHLIA